MILEQTKNIMFPSISIITVVYNSVNLIEETIKSVLEQDYPNLEYIIIDGGSADGTIQLIKKYEGKISLFISEPDKGIYDAMNKGIEYAHGEWINFMNSGDCFCTNDVLINIFSGKIDDTIRFIYSDYYVKKGNRKRVYTASLEKGHILHQSCIYKKTIHREYGKYYVSNPLIVSDYLFFNLIQEEFCIKTNVVISINDGNGVSSGSWIIPQKYCLDYVFQRISLFQMFYLIFVGYIKSCLLWVFNKLGR